MSYGRWFLIWREVKGPLLLGGAKCRYWPFSTVVAGRRFGRYWGKSRHSRLGSKTKRMTHSVTSPPSIAALLQAESPLVSGAPDRRCLSLAGRELGVTISLADIAGLGAGRGTHALLLCNEWQQSRLNRPELRNRRQAPFSAGAALAKL
jgi:hypothetical protein